MGNELFGKFFDDVGIRLFKNWNGNEPLFNTSSYKDKLILKKVINDPENYLNNLDMIRKIQNSLTNPELESIQKYCLLEEAIRYLCTYHIIRYALAQGSLVVYVIEEKWKDNIVIPPQAWQLDNVKINLKTSEAEFNLLTDIFYIDNQQVPRFKNIKGLMVIRKDIAKEFKSKYKISKSKYKPIELENFVIDQVRQDPDRSRTTASMRNEARTRFKTLDINISYRTYDACLNKISPRKLGRPFANRSTK